MKKILTGFIVLLSLGLSLPLFAAADITFKGTVSDSAGLPVPGAAVVSVSDNTRSAITDINGAFSLKAEEGEIFEVTCLGFAKVAVKAGTSPASIVLEEDFTMLDEVVFVGYGTQKRSDITGAISSVSPEEMTKIPTTSVAEMLRGTAAGVQVNLSSAAPGGSSSVIIRGRRSPNGGNDPIYIVDGVPMSNIDDLNPYEIESLEVLKDASSQSIYGARASNGVILVTTKRGLEGVTRVSYDGAVNVQKAIRNFDYFSPEEYIEYRKAAFANGGYDVNSAFNMFMQECIDNNRFIDWENEVIHPAVNHRHDILIQSGTDRTKIAFGLGGVFQNGMIDGFGYQKLNGRLNLDHKFTSWFSMGVNLTYTKSWKQTGDSDFNSLVTACPIGSIYDDDGKLAIDPGRNGETTNPLYDMQYFDKDTNVSRWFANVFADVKFSKHFSYRLNASMNNRNSFTGTYYGINHYKVGRLTDGKAITSEGQSNQYMVENIFNYNQDFSLHHIDATAMQSLEVNQSATTGLTGTHFANDGLGYYGIQNASEPGTPTYTRSKRTLISFLGRVRYSFADRYLFSAALRVDGSSVFGANNKWGFFPSASAAWRITEEPWMKSSSDWLSNLKLRVSWGQVGNQGIDPYQTLGVATRYPMDFGGISVTGYMPGEQMVNPNLKWETSTTANIGIDFGFWRGRLSGALELYNTDTKDLLIEKSLSTTTGYTSEMINMGKVNNKGIELTLNTIPVKTRDFEWDVNLAFSTNKNTIVYIDGKVDENGKPVDDITQGWFIGKPLNNYFGYVFDGIWQEGEDNSLMPGTKPGDIRVKDINGDEKIDLSDRTVFKRDPNWIGSLSTSFMYKGFDLSVDFYYSAGGFARNTYLYDWNYGGALDGKRNGIKREYWTPENKSNSWPAPNLSMTPNYLTNAATVDKSFFSIRNAQFGYTFPAKLISKARMQSLRVYVSGTNLLYVSDFLGYGPETEAGSFPEARTFQFGVKVSF